MAKIVGVDEELIVPKEEQRKTIQEEINVGNIDVVQGIAEDSDGTYLTGRVRFKAGANISLAVDKTDNIFTITSAAGSGSSKWTDAGAITYLTATSDDLAVGGTDSSAPFFFDVSAGDLKLTGQLTDGTSSTDPDEIRTHIDDTSIHADLSTLSHTSLLNIGTNTHAQIDTHIAESTIQLTDMSQSQIQISEPTRR